MQPTSNAKPIAPSPPGEREVAAHAGDSRRALETLDRLGRVHVQPGPLIAVLAASGEEPDAVAKAIESSPALTARLLCVTNSAGVGLARQIDCVRRAVIHLGASRARLIAMAFGLRMLSESSGLEPGLVQMLWVNSLRKAAAARLAAELIDPRAADRAYSYALLQDVGLPMLVAVDPNFYSHELTPNIDRGDWIEQERARFGIDHAQVGRRLLEEWDASSRACDAVLDHHRPPGGDGDEATLRLPLFIASLLPHLAEPMTPREQEWMIALHAQLLSTQYPTPDAFFAAAARTAQPLHGGTTPPPRIQMAQVQQLVKALSADVEGMVVQLCQLEDAVGKQREHLSHLRFQAFTDPLTKVLNRRGFLRLAQRRLEQAVCANVGICTLVIDLDDFKPVNDRFGHEAGDLVLRGLAKLLRRNLDRADLIGRIGGDEFVILLTNVDENKARQIGLRLDAICKATRIRISPEETVPLRLSLGAAYCDAPARDTTIDDLIAAADETMYQRKHSGKGGINLRRFEPTLP